VLIPGGGAASARKGVEVLAAEFLAAHPAPRPTATFPDLKALLRETACKNIVARGVFEPPPLTMGALLGVHEFPCRLQVETLWADAILPVKKCRSEPFRSVLQPSGASSVS
jgi:hypothetical protein